MCPLGQRNTLSVKASYYDEDSQLTYSGLRESEWLANPRSNPFLNDRLSFKRYGASAVHNLVLSSNTVVTTSAYGSIFDRAVPTS